MKTLTALALILAATSAGAAEPCGYLGGCDFVVTPPPPPPPVYDGPKIGEAPSEEPDEEPAPEPDAPAGGLGG